MRASLHVFVLACTLSFLAAPAHATWVGSGAYTIQILVNGVPTVIQPGAIDNDDELYTVRVGQTFPTELEGVVTVLQEQGVERRFLGDWSIVNGTANVQATYGDGSWSIGEGANENDLAGVLDVLGSDITGPINVRHGTLRVHTGSRVENIDVFEFGTAYLEGSFIGALQTDPGGHAYLSHVVANTAGTSEWRGTVVVDDSTITAQNLRVWFGGVGEIGLLSIAPPAITASAQLSVYSGNLSIQGATVTTGSIEVRGAGALLDVNGGTWTNAGELNFLPSAGDPDTMRLRGGAELRGLGMTWVAGNPGFEHMIVTDSGTLLEVEDLHVGEFYSPGLGHTQAYSGTLTVADGATIIVHGTLQIGAEAVLNLEEGGTIYAAAIDDQGGTINENGGQLVLPEPGAIEEAIAAFIGVAAIARRHRAA